MKNRVQEMRWEKNWSVTELSKRSGVPKATISTIENSPWMNPTVATAFGLARAFNISIEEIFMNESF